MSGTVRVLIYGSASAGVCDYYRLGMYRDRLAELGVETRLWSDFGETAIEIPDRYAGRLADAVHDGVAQLNRAPLDWADVILFRRWYSVAPCCEDCDTTGTETLVAGHCAATGHHQNSPDMLARFLVATFVDQPEILRGRAIVYETDDNLLGATAWLPFYRRLEPDRPMLEALLRRADLVTVSTPVLAQIAGRYNDSVRVVRNAVDRSWYEGASPLPDLAGDPRILYYGISARLRDYEVCREIVDLTVQSNPGARRVWLGSDGPEIRHVVDEAHPYVEGVEAFARRLVAVRPDIGLAPVVGDEFDRAHSELHWLEYSLAGAATIASRTMGGGPYDVIRDGVDGILARNGSEWRYGLRRLVGSAALRADLVGRARERVLLEYDPGRRAVELADAYRWAAENGGRGAVSRFAGATPSALAVRTAAEGRANFDHRQRVRAQSAFEKEQLLLARGDRDVCWPVGASDDPLVSVIIPTYNRGRLLVERSLASVLAQTHRNLDVVVVGDCATPETVEAMSSVTDPRVRFENLPVRGPRPPEPERAWQTSGSRPFNVGLTLARGSWIAIQADDDEFTPDHVEVLLAAAIENRIEMIYGASWMESTDESWFRLGSWPPQHAGFCAGAVLYSAGLSFLGYDEECWREDEPNDWNLWRRMLEAGVRVGYLDRVVFRHYEEARHRVKVS
jgi:hypothetical protein